MLSFKQFIHINEIKKFNTIGQLENFIKNILIDKEMTIDSVFDAANITDKKLKFSTFQRTWNSLLKENFLLKTKNNKYKWNINK